MRHPSFRFVRPALVPLFLVGGMGVAIAADGAPLPPAPVVEAPVAMPPVWSFRFVPYGWLTSLKGTQTVRGRSTKVDASFIDIVEKSDTLVGLMGTFEARNGPFALYGDLVWSKVGIEGSNVRTRTPAPGIESDYRALNFDPLEAYYGFRRVKAAFRSGDIELLADVAHYPVTVTGKTRRTIRDRDQLITAQRTVMDPHVRDVVARSTFETLFVRDKGMMLGDGEVWITRGNTGFGLGAIHRE